MAQQQQQFQQQQNVGAGIHFGGHVQAGYNNCPPVCPPKNPCKPKLNWSSRRCEGKSKQVCPEDMINGCNPVPYAPQQPVCTPIGNQMNDPNNFQAQQYQQQQQQQQQYHQQQFQQQQQQRQQYIEKRLEEDKSKWDVTNPDNRHTTKVNVSFGGSQDEFHNGSRDPTWAPKSLDMFSDMGDMAKAVVLEVKVEKYDNTFPFPVGVNFKGFEGMVHTDSGKVLINMYGNSGEHVGGQHVWYPKKVATSLIMQNYGHMKPESIRNGIVAMPNEKYSLVANDHVIPRIIRLNEHKLGIDLEKFPVKNKYHVIENNLIERCIEELNTQVFSKIGDIITDFNKLEATLVRTDGFEWDDTDHISGIGTKNSQIMNNIYTSYNTVNVEFSIQYAYASSNNDDE